MIHQSHFKIMVKQLNFTKTKGENEHIVNLCHTTNYKLYEVLIQCLDKQ